MGRDGDAWSQIVPNLDHRMEHRLVNRDPIRYGNVSKPGRGTDPVRQITATDPVGTRTIFLHFMGRFLRIPRAGAAETGNGAVTD